MRSCARSAQEQRQKRLAWAGVALLALLLGGVAWVLRRTRRLNRSLEEQRALLAAQAEQLTELDRAKSAFFANVSHELRTPAHAHRGAGGAAAAARPRLPGSRPCCASA